MILAFDTCGLDFSVALVKEGKIVLDYLCSEEQKQVEQLVPSIEKLLTEAGITYSDLKAVVVTKGPGSFNGIRIGYATASAIAFAKKIPLFSISSFIAIFYQALQDKSVNFPMNFAYLLDRNSSLVQRFTHEKDYMGVPVQVDSCALSDQDYIFSLKNFSWKNSVFSKAAATGLAFFDFPDLMKEGEVFYGKEPSIG